MNAAKRAAFEVMVKRYTKAKKATREIARRTLIDEGIYTEEGKVSFEYGGEPHPDRPPQTDR